MPAAKETMPALPVLLLRARLAVAMRYNQALREHGLTEQQWRVLASISREEFADIATLARRVDLLSPSVSRILRDLEMRGALLRAAGHEEAIKGSITPGKLADFVILSEDPHLIDPNRIKDITIVQTVTGGRTVYEA